MSENGSMSYMPNATNAKQAVPSINASARHMETDEQKEERLTAGADKGEIIVESENGSMMHSEKSVGNANHSDTVSPSPINMPAEEPKIKKDVDPETKTEKFKKAKQRLDQEMLDKQEDMSDNKLTVEQQKMLMQRLMLQKGSIE